MAQMRLAIRALKKPWLVLLICALVAHGLLLLNDGIFYDSWFFYIPFLERNWSLLYAGYAETSRPIFTLFYGLIAPAPDPVFAIRLTAFATIYAVSLMTFVISRKLGWLSVSASLLLALFVLLFPSYQVQPENTTTLYMGCLALHLLGVWFALRAEDAQRTVTHIAYRAAAFVCWFISVNTGSLLVFHFGLLPLIYMYAKDRNAQSVPITIIKRPDYVIAPILYYVLTNRFFPPIAWITYNVPTLSSVMQLSFWRQFISEGILAQFAWSLGVLNALGALLIVLLSPALVRWLRLDDAHFFGAPFTQTRARTLLIAAYGVALLALAILPYVAVGTLPFVHGFATRHTLLIGIPLGILFVAFMGIFFANGTSVRFVGALISLIVLASFARAQIDNYLAWQAAWVKDRSIMANLPRVPNIRQNAILAVDDQYGSVDGEWWPYYLRHFGYDWTGIFRYTFGSEWWPVSDDRTSFVPRPNTRFPELMLITKYDPAGCQARLTVRRGDAAAQLGPLGLARRYWYYRFFAPNGMDDFLRSLSTLQLTPIVAPEATHCTR